MHEGPLPNAFEKGTGLRFTYHHAPCFISKDHKFFDPAFGIACYFA